MTTNDTQLPSKWFAKIASSLLPTSLTGVTLFTLLTVALLPQAMAGVLLERQIQDNGTWFPSYTTSDGSIDTEAADDFELTADIDRINFGGNISSATAIQGVILRFYAPAPQGGPGVLQAQYEFAADDPALLLSYDYVDVSLPTVFSASGRHFVSVQIVADTQWSKGSANWSGTINNERVYTRNGGAGWVASGFSVDMSYSIYGTSTGVPAVDNLSADSVTRSGLLQIGGNSFGDGGEVLIGGVAAHVASWQNDSITVYTSETTPLGSNALVVRNSMGESAPLNVGITERSSTERIAWEFPYVGAYSMVRPVAVADGTIYTIDVSGYLYALDAAGALKWLRAGTGGHGLAVGADGTIYTGGHNGVFAFTPAGDLKWSYDLTGVLTYRFGSVAVGPDGNVYAGTTGDHGLFSLNPADGSLRWSSPIAVDVAQNDYGHVAFNTVPNPTQVLYNTGAGTHVHDLDGNALFITYGRNPVIAANGNIYLGPFIVAPDGQTLCMVSDGLKGPAVDSTNLRYGVSVDLVIHDETCNENGRHTIPQYPVGIPVLDASESMLILAASGTTTESFTYAMDVNSGKELWRQYLPMIGGQLRFLHTSALFAADNGSYYLNTGISGALTQGYLTAISISAGNGEVNLAPSADAQSVTTVQDAAVAITLTGSDPNAGDILSFAVVDGSGPFSGTLSGTAPNLVYTPAPGYFGTDRFDFVVSDDKGAVSAPGRVSISVTKLNQRPVAVNDSVTMDADSSVVVDVLANDYDPDGDSFGINWVERNRYISASINKDGTLTLKTKKSAQGTLSIQYEIIDSAGNTSDPLGLIDVIVNAAGNTTGNGNK